MTISNFGLSGKSLPLLKRAILMAASLAVLVVWFAFPQVNAEKKTTPTRKTCNQQVTKQSNPKMMKNHTYRLTQTGDPDGTALFSNPCPPGWIQCSNGDCVMLILGC